MSPLLHSSKLRIALLLLAIPLLLLTIRMVQGNSWQTQGIHRMLDPFIYTGYIHNYQGLVQDFGHTYYGNRIAHILPSKVFNDWIGGWSGYQAYRVLLWLAGFWGAWFMARRFVSSEFMRWILAALFVTSPWFATGLFADHYDSTAIVLLLWVFVGLTESLARAGEGCSSWAGYLGSGVLYAWVINTNIFLAGVAGVAWIASFIVLLLCCRFRKAVLSMMIGFVGWFIGYWVLVLALNLLLLPAESAWYYDVFSIGISLSMVTAGEQWYQPLTTYLITNHGWHILLPLVVGIILLIQFIGRRFWIGSSYRLPDVMLSWYVVLVLMGTFAVFLFMSQVLKAAVITLIFYFVYLLPATWLAVLLLFRDSASDQRSAVQPLKRILAVAAILVILLPAWTSEVDYRLLNAGYLLLVAGVWMACRVSCKTLLHNTWAGVALFGALCGLLSSPLFNYREYRSIPVERHVYVRDLWEASLYISREVRDHKKEGEKYGFWYANDEKALHAVNACFLWGYSRLQGLNNDGVGMPVLSDRDRLNLEEFSQLILLGYNRNEIDTGLAALSAESLQWQTLGKGFYPGREKEYHYQLIRFIR